MVRHWRQDVSSALNGVTRARPHNLMAWITWIEAFSASRVVTFLSILIEIMSFYVVTSSGYMRVFFTGAQRFWPELAAPCCHRSQRGQGSKAFASSRVCLFSRLRRISLVSLVLGDVDAKNGISGRPPFFLALQNSLLEFQIWSPDLSDIIILVLGSFKIFRFGNVAYEVPRSFKSRCFSPREIAYGFPDFILLRLKTP